MAYDNSMKGSLFRNERKRDDKDPSHQGSCEIDGKQFWISAWVQESGPQSKNPGTKFFSLKFKPKDAAAGAGAKSSTPPPARSAPPARAATPAPKQETTDLEGDDPY